VNDSGEVVQWIEMEISFVPGPLDNLLARLLSERQASKKANPTEDHAAIRRAVFITIFLSFTAGPAA